MVSKPRFEDSGPNLTKSDQISPKSVPDQYQTSTRPVPEPSFKLGCSAGAFLAGAFFSQNSGVRLRRCLAGAVFSQNLDFFGFFGLSKTVFKGSGAG